MTGSLLPNQFLVSSLMSLMTRVILFATEPLRSESLCNILSDERMDLSVVNIVKCQHHLYSMRLKVLPFTIYTGPL
jgi:hypothetical protein